MRKYIIGSRAFERRKLEEFRATGGEAILTRGVEAVIKAADDEERAFDFTISTESVDRYGDTVAVDGWKLENFRKNPVVLWMHNNSLRPVARATNVRVEEGRLKARTVFRPEGQDAFADGVLNDIRGGFLKATSVGFIPLKYAFVDDPERRFGIDFLEQELLEFSIVTVPANAEALIENAVQEHQRGASLDFARRRLAALKAA